MNYTLKLNRNIRKSGNVAFDEILYNSIISYGHYEYFFNFEWYYSQQFKKKHF